LKDPFSGTVTDDSVEIGVNDAFEGGSGGGASTPASTPDNDMSSASLSGDTEPFNGLNDCLLKGILVGDISCFPTLSILIDGAMTPTFALLFPTKDIMETPCDMVSIDPFCDPGADDLVDIGVKDAFLCGSGLALEGASGGEVAAPATTPDDEVSSATSSEALLISLASSSLLIVPLTSPSVSGDNDGNIDCCCCCWYCRC
jgi:hypothetical protein